MWTEYTEYEEYHHCSSAEYSDISKITHSAKYRLIIVIEKNRDLFFFSILHTLSVLSLLLFVGISWSWF